MSQNFSTKQQNKQKQSSMNNRSSKQPSNAQKKGIAKRGQNQKWSVRAPTSTGRLGLGQLGGSNFKKKIHFCEGDEFVAAVNGSTGSAMAPTVTAYAFNPGQAATFPRAAKEAILYEKWNCSRGYAEFYYKRIVSEFNSNGSAGKVLLSFDYDASDAPPATVQQVEDTDPCKDGMPCDPYIRLPLDVKQLMGGIAKENKFMRPGGLPGSSDIKTYDGGNLYVTCYGQGATTAVGELRVRYRFEFMIPVLESSTVAPTNNSVAIFTSNGAEASGATTVATNLALATATTNGIGAVNTAGSIVLPAGNYLLDLTVSTHSTTAVASALKADIFVSGVTVQTAALAGGGLYDFTLGGAGTFGNATVAATWFFASNGTAPLTFPVTTTYASGIETIAGTLRIVSM